MSGRVDGGFDFVVTCPYSLTIPSSSPPIPGHTGDLSRVLGRHLLVSADLGINHWTRMGTGSISGRACNYVFRWFGTFWEKEEKERGGEGRREGWGHCMYDARADVINPFLTCAVFYAFSDGSTT